MLRIVMMCFAQLECNFNRNVKLVFSGEVNAVGRCLGAAVANILKQSNAGDLHRLPA